MARIVVLGAGIGGMSAAYELRGTLGQGVDITVVGEGDRFSFTPSNPWVAVGWRKPSDLEMPVARYLAKKNIAFEGVGAERAEPDHNRVRLRDGRTLDYDYLVIATGPRLAFDEVPGLGPEGGFTHSICTTPHATTAWQAYQAFSFSSSFSAEKEAKRLVAIRRLLLRFWLQETCQAFVLKPFGYSARR